MHCTQPEMFLPETAQARDLRLVTAAQAGSSAAFEQLQQLYSRKVYRRICAITKNREDAEDAMQDTFLRAFLALEGFERRSSFYSWITRIAINSALMVLRKRRARPEIPFEPRSEAEDEIPQMEVKDPSLNPEQICDQHQRCARMLHAVRKLDPALRSAMQLHMSDDCSNKEIGRALGISEIAVKARIHRARRRLTKTNAFKTLGTAPNFPLRSRREGPAQSFLNLEQSCGGALAANPGGEASIAA